MSQLCFSWFVPGQGRRGSRRAMRLSAASCNHRWPPRKGDTLYFETDLGIQAGIFREARQGLVWVGPLEPVPALQRVN